MDQISVLIQAVNEARDIIVKHTIRLSTYVSESVGVAGASTTVSSLTGSMAELASE